MSSTSLQNRLPVTTSFLPSTFSCKYAEELLQKIYSSPDLLEQFPFLPELAEVEILRDKLYQNPPDVPNEVTSWQIHPGIELLEVSWSGFPELFMDEKIIPARKNSIVMFLPQGHKTKPILLNPDNNILLALKIVAENLDLLTLAKELDTSVPYLQNVLQLGVINGIILQPPSKLTRAQNFCSPRTSFKNFLTTNTFTLQWHITQNCDLHCRHCYDRSQRREVSLVEGKKVLDQLYNFCKHYRVVGQVSFTGGNPLLHPVFLELYREAHERGLMTAILGNPTGPKTLEKILKIQNLEFYQVSLEGLRDHNDYIRGQGHFDRVMQFLELLKEMDIYSMVMLTLTRDNQDQVLPLAEKLRSKVDLFTFNRLAMVGEGAALASAPTENYRGFLHSYMEAAKSNPHMRLKDNLFNILLAEQGREVGGGCAGHGCGAAFNFVSLLPDGQVHACRKLPSPVGDINQDDLITIYESDEAKRFRMGSSGCSGCRLHPVCGGCPAVTHGFGQNELTAIDPYCFLGK